MKISFLVVFFLAAYITNAQEIHVNKQAGPSVRLERHPNWQDSLDMPGSNNLSLDNPRIQYGKPDNMPVAGQIFSKPFIVEKNKNGYMIYESPVDHSRGIMPGKENIFNMPIVGAVKKELINP